jgi:hypothetical protein
MNSPFKVDPLLFLVDAERQNAVLSYQRYFTCFTGSYFEKLADKTNSNRITESDITAVSMLGVNIPAGTIIWLLSKEGTGIVSNLLAKTPNDTPIWDDDIEISPDSPAWQLWRVLRRTNWLHRDRRTGMGRTKTSKLLAAKRPHLIPVWDSVTNGVLFGTNHVNDWSAWRERLTGSQGQLLRDAAIEVQDEAHSAANLSVLRVIDVVVWMRVRGWRYDSALSHFGSLPSVGQ